MLNNCNCLSVATLCFPWPREYATHRCAWVAEQILPVGMLKCYIFDSWLCCQREREFRALIVRTFSITPVPPNFLFYISSLHYICSHRQAVYNRSNYSTGWDRLVYFPPATSIPSRPGEGSGWGGYSIVGSEERNFPGLGPHLSFSLPPKWTYG